MKKEPFLPIGSAIINRSEGRSYTLHSLIGQGGFAQCYEVVEDHTQRRYAAKIVRKTDLTKPKNRQKLLTEIKIHLSVTHKHIVKLYNYFEDKSHVFLVMELCTNKSVMDLLKKTKKIEERHVKVFILQILSALEYLHKQCSVVHRDMKLGNLFLDEHLNIKVGDFGLAAVIESEERKKTICGTPNYIAPEVLFNSEDGHSFEVDIWSLGVILYTLLVGKPPFQKSDVKEIYRSIKTNSYHFPEEGVSPEAKDLIQRLLDPEPEKRPKIEEIYASPFLKGVELQIKESSSGERHGGLLHTIYVALQGRLDNLENSPILASENNGVDCVVSTVDCTKKYGVGYLMRSGSVGILFNDCTSLLVREPVLFILLSNPSFVANALEGREESVSVEYFEHRACGAQKVITKERISLEKTPEALRKKVLLINYFIDQLDLRESPPLCEYVEEQAFVIKHVLFPRGPVLRLSNRIAVFVVGERQTAFAEDGRLFGSTLPEDLLYCRDALKKLLKR
jgi:serine/threonine protein kinase